MQTIGKDRGRSVMGNPVARYPIAKQVAFGFREWNRKK